MHFNTLYIATQHTTVFCPFKQDCIELNLSITFHARSICFRDKNIV